MIWKEKTGILEIPRIRKYRSENQFSVFPNFVPPFLDRAKFRGNFSRGKEG